MRNVAYLLPVSLLFAAACSSAPKTNAPDPVDPIEGGGVPLTGTTGGSQDMSDGFAQDVQNYTLQEQKKMFLVAQHIANAQSMREQLHLSEALRELEMALQLSPDNLEAKTLRNEVTALLGYAPGEAKTVAAQLAEQHGLKVQQLKAEAGDHLRAGKVALSRGDYDAAIAELSLCLTSVQYVPYSVDWEGVDTEAAELLNRAKTDRTAAAEALRIADQRASYEALREREQSESARQQAIVANIMMRAIDSFEAADYNDAEELAKEVLRKEPRNSQAEELRDASFRASRAKARTEYIDAKREEFARWREHMAELEVPWNQVITLPDRDDWRRITQNRAGRRGLDISQKISETDIALRRQLASETVVLPGIQDEESLRAVIDIIRQFTGLPLVVDPAAENAALDEGVVFNFNLENRISVQQALNLITGQAGDEVTWTIRHEAVLITTKEKARGEPVIYNHDVQDLILGLTDFTGPRIDRLRLLDELEDDDGGGPFGGLLESPRLIEIEDLATLIQENVAVGSWEDDGVSIEPGEAFILIVHSPEIQQQVKDFLEDLRRFNSSLVTIESKFMTVGDNWIQEIGVDFRGLDNQQLDDVTNGLEDMASLGLDNGGSGNEAQGAAGPPSAGFFYDDGGDGDFKGTTQNFFGDALGSAVSTIGGLTFQLTFLNDLNLSAILRAVEKSSQFELINSQILSVHNTQRAYVTVINQQAYIQDFDVEVAAFQAVADPQVNVLHEGVVLDVRPTIHHNRKYLTLEIQPTVAKVIALRDFSSTLGGNTSPVEFQLPEIEVQSVNTSAIIPDGGSILLGGLSRIRNIERRAEVPWISRIPVIGFLFKNEGYNDEKQSLMILIRARITDVREAVADKLERDF
jgi:tetratricopeptide (TPR) repeat protein